MHRHKAVSSHGVGVGQHTSDFTNDPKQAYFFCQRGVGEEVGEHQTDSSSTIIYNGNT